MQLSKKEIDAIIIEFKFNVDDEKKFREYVKERNKRKVWPVEYKWWFESKDIMKVAKKYKYLAPLLIELHSLTALHQDKNAGLGVEPLLEIGQKKEYVLLDLSKYRSGMAKRIGCSETALRNYIQGLCECDLIVFFDKGRRTFYSMATWGIMPADQDAKEFVPKKIPWLTAGTSFRLLKFKPVR